jgi:hypothetical protein
MKFAILSLVILPPALLLSTWVSMQIKLIHVRREPTEDEWRDALNNWVRMIRVVCLEIQKHKTKE